MDEPGIEPGTFSMLAMLRRCHTARPYALLWLVERNVNIWLKMLPSELERDDATQSKIKAEAFNGLCEEHQHLDARTLSMINEHYTHSSAFRTRDEVAQSLGQQHRSRQHTHIYTTRIDNDSVSLEDRPYCPSPA